MYVYSYLKTAENIISQFTGEVSLALHLKAYFKLNKKYGGRDRKEISHFCYCYYRIGNLFKEDDIATKLKKSIFLCSTEPSKTLEHIDETYNAKVQENVSDKLIFLNVSNPNQIFPQHHLLSNLKNVQAFLEAQLQQPFLFIRIRPKHLAEALIQVNKLNIAHKVYDPYTVQLPNGFKVEEHFEVNKTIVIQDYNSQRVLDQLLALLPEKQFLKIWDCCAASGGKSILLSDSYQGKLDLYVTDIRETILANLEKRFLSAKIMNYKLATHNVAEKGLGKAEQFDVVLCDVPCSGSGTWSRTPEQKKSFKQKQLDQYKALQFKIAKNAATNVKQHGYMLYITCSVFKAENEDNVETLLTHNPKLKLVNMQLLEGAAVGADTMFVAIMQMQ